MVSYVLNHFLRKFVKEEGLKATKVNFSLSEIKLSDLELLPEALDFLDLPSVNVKYGRVGSLTLSIPGGAIAWLVSKKAPITVAVADVHILVDKKISLPGEAEAKLQADKASALDLDAALYRQQLADRVVDLLSGSVGAAAASASGSGAPKSLVEAAMLKLRVSVERVHIRYEDQTSHVAAPFAAGVTLESLSLHSDEHAVDSPGSSRHGIELRSLAAYWDPLALDGAFVRVGDRAATSRCFDGGIARVGAPPAKHCFVVEPVSFSLTATRRNPSATTSDTEGSAGPAALHAVLRIPSVCLCLSRAQVLQGAFLGKWVADQTSLRLRDELKRNVVDVPGGSPQLQAWRRAVACVVKLHRRQPRAGGLPRWDRSRIAGSLHDRAAYIAAYSTVLARESALLQGARKAAPDLASDPVKLAAGVDADAAAKAAIAVVRLLETRLLYEQVVDFRIEARLAVEGERAVRDAAKAASSGGGSWWWSVPSPAPAGAAPVFDAVARRAELQDAISVSKTDSEQLHLKVLLDEASLTLRTGFTAATPSAVGDAPWAEPRLLTLKLAGWASLSQRRSGALAVRAALSSMAAVDNATQRTAYPMLVEPRMAVGASTKALHFFDLLFEQVPTDRQSAAMRLKVDSQPLHIVLVPTILRGLASFALSPATAALSSGISADLAALRSRAPADVYAMLVQRQCIVLEAKLAAPTFVVPDDLSDASGGETRLHLGELHVRSQPDNCPPHLLAEWQASATGPAATGPTDALLGNAPIVLSAKQWPLEFDESQLEGVMQDRAPIPGVILDAPLPSSPRPTATAPHRAASFSTLDHASQAYDSYSIALSNFAVEVFDPHERIGGCVDPTRATPVVQPVTFAVTAEMSFLPATEQPEALRVQARVHRIAAVSSLALAQRGIYLQRMAMALLADVNAMSEVLGEEFAAANTANASLEASRLSALAPAWVADEVPVAVRDEGPKAMATATGPKASAPTAIVVDVNLGELSLLVFDVRRVVRTVVERRLATANAAPESFRDTATAALALPGRVLSSVGDGASDPEFSITARSISITAKLSPQKADATISCGALSVVDRFQRSGASFSDFVSSIGAGAIAGAPLLELKARYAAPNGACGPKVLAQLEAGTLLVGYNPETMAALQWYMRFIVECLAIGAPPDKPSLATTVLPAAAAAASTSPLSAPSSSAQLQSVLDLVSQAGDGSAAKDNVEKPVDESSPPPAALSVLASARIGSLVLVLHKENKKRKIARVAIAGLCIAVRHVAGDAGDTLADIELREIAVLATSASLEEPGLASSPHEVPLFRIPDERHSVKESPGVPPSSFSRPGCALRVRFQQWATTTAAGLDLAMDCGVAPLSFVLVAPPVLELADYAQKGLIKSLLAAAGASTGRSLAVAQTRDTRMSVKLALSAASCVIPAGDRTSVCGGDSLIVNLSGVTACSQPYEIDTAPVIPLCNRLLANIGTLSCSSCCEGSAPQWLLRSTRDAEFDVRFPLGASAPGSLAVDAAVGLPGLAASVSDTQVRHVMAVLQGNLGGRAFASQAVTQRAPTASDATLDTSWLGISYGSDAPTHAAPAHQSPMRLRVTMAEGISVVLNPSLAHSCIVAELRRPVLVLFVDRECAGSIDAVAEFDRLEITEIYGESGAPHTTSLLCANVTTLESSQAVSIARTPSIAGISCISPDLRSSAHRDKHLVARVALDPRSKSTLVELAVMHTTLTPSATGALALLAMARALASSSPRSDPRTTVDVAFPSSLDVPDPDSKSRGEDLPDEARQLVSHAVSEPPKSQGGSVECRVLLVGFCLMLSPDPLAPTTSLGMSIGAEANLSLSNATKTTPPILALRAGIDLGAFVQPAFVPGPLSSAVARSAVLEQVTMACNVDVAGELESGPLPPRRSVELQAGVLRIDIQPSLLSIAIGVAKSFDAAGLFSKDSAATVESPAAHTMQVNAIEHSADTVTPPPSESSSKPLPALSDTTSSDTASRRPTIESYKVSWEGLVIGVGDGSESRVSPTRLLKARIDPVRLTVNSSDGLSYQASACLSAQVHLWSPERQEWDPLTLEPWAFDATVLARLGPSDTRMAEPAVDISVTATSELRLRLVAARIQNAVAGVGAWQRFADSLLAEPLSQSTLKAPIAVSSPEPLAVSMSDAPTDRRTALRLSLRFPCLSAELVSTTSHGKFASVVKLVLQELRVDFDSFDVLRDGSRAALSGATATVSLAGMHILDLMAAASLGGAPMLLTSAASVDEQRVVFLKHCLEAVSSTVTESSAKPLAPASTTFLRLLFVRLSLPCSQVLRELVSSAATDQALETASLDFALGTLGASIRASTLREVLQFAASSLRVSPSSVLPSLSTTGNAAPPVPRRSAPLDSDATNLVPPSAILGISARVRVSQMTVALHSDALLCCLAILEIRDVSATALVFESTDADRDNSHTKLSCSVGDLRIRDSTIADPASPYASIISPAPVATTPLLSLSLHMFGRHCEVPACIVLTAALQPVRAVLLAPHMEHIVEVATTELIRAMPATSVSTSHSSIVVTTPLNALSADVARRAVPATLLVSLDIVMGGLECVLPVSSTSSDSAILRVGRVSARTRDPALLRVDEVVALHLAQRSSSADDTTSAESSPGLLPVDSLDVSIADITFEAHPGGGTRATLLQMASTLGAHAGASVAVRRPISAGSLADAWAASGLVHACGLSVAVTLPPFAVSLTPPTVHLLRRVLDCNLTSVPRDHTIDRQRQMCSRVEPYIPEPLLAARTAAAAASCCVRCSTAFGAIVAASRCESCGGAVCFACLVSRVFDEEAGRAKDCCSFCWDDLVGRGPESAQTESVRPRQLAEDVAPPIADSGAPLRIHLSLPDVTVTLTTPVDALAAVASRGIADLARLHISGIDISFRALPSLDREETSRSVAHVTIRSLALLDVRPASTEVNQCSAASRVIVSANERALRGVVPRSSRALVGVAAAQANSHHVEVIFTTTSLPGTVARSQCQVLLMHCDINPDPGALLPIAQFFSGYERAAEVPRPQARSSDANTAAASGIAAPRALGRRAAPMILGLSVTIAHPRIMLIESLHSSTSRVLLLSLSVYAQLRAVVEPAAWGLVALPANGVTSTLRCRRQLSQTSLSVRVNELGVAVTRLVGSDASHATIAVSSDRKDILPATSLKAELELKSDALLSVGCNPRVWLRDNPSVASDAATAFTPAASPSAMLPRTSMSCEVDPLHFTLAYSDALLARQVSNRLIGSPAGPSSPAGEPVALPPSSEPPVADSAAFTEICSPVRQPDAWHGCDYELLIPVGTEIGAAFDVLPLQRHALPALSREKPPLPDSTAPLLLALASPAVSPTASDASLDANSRRAAYDAIRAAVKTGDVLLAIDGVPVAGLTAEQAGAMLAAALGSRPARSLGAFVRLRWRAALLSVAVVAQGLRATLVDDEGGRTDVLLDFEMGRVSVDAVDSSMQESARHSGPAAESRFARVSVASLALSFYNPRVGALEPIVERFQVAALAYSVDAALSTYKQHAVQPSGGALPPGTSPRDSVALTPSLQRSSASRPLRVVDVAVSPVEVVVSHAAVATLVPAFTTLQTAATHLVKGESNASAERGADLAAAQEEAKQIGAGVLQHASLASSALPVVFRNSSGFPAVLCVMRTAPGASDPCVVLFSTPQPDASLGGAGLVSNDDAVAAETLRAAVEASVVASDGPGNVALIAVAHGCAVGLATAAERSALGAVTALHADKSSTAAAAAVSFPALRVYAGSDASAAVADLPSLQALPSSFALPTSASPHRGAAPLPIIVQVSTPSARHRVVDLRSCAAVHNACSLPLEVHVGTGAAGSASLRLAGVVASKSSLFLPTPPGGFAVSGLRVRPLLAPPAPGGAAAAAAGAPTAAEYALSGAAYLGADFSVELLCPPARPSPGVPDLYIGAVSRHGDSPRLTSVLFYAPIVLTNALPLPLSFRMGPRGGAGGREWPGTLAPGESREVFEASGGRATGRLVLPDDRSQPSAAKPDPALGIQIPRGRPTPMEPLSGGSFDFRLLSDVDGVSSPPAALRADVARVAPCADGGLDASSAPDAQALQIAVTVYADVWVANLTGLPLTLGQTRPGFRGVEGTEGSVLPASHQFADLLECDEVFENERFTLFGPSSSTLLPTDPPNFCGPDFMTPCRPGDLEARMPRGWAWTGPWRIDPWDHEFNFPNFVNGRHDFNKDKRMTDHVRRRRYHRLRVFVRPAAASSGAAAAAARPAVIPGVVPSYSVVQPLAPMAAGGAVGPPHPLSRTPKVASGAALGAPQPEEAAIALLAAPQQQQQDAAAGAASTAFVRLLSGPWSEAVSLDLAGGRPQAFGVSGPPDPAQLRGAQGGPTYVPINRCYVVAHVTQAPPQFRCTRPGAPASRVLTLRAAVTLVNATGAPLYWRQADSARVETRDKSPLRTDLAGSLAEHVLVPGASTPLWMDAEGHRRDVMLSPEAAWGGWSAPLPLHASARAYSLLIPVSGGGGAVGAGSTYVHTALGKTPAATVVLGVAVREVPGAPGCFVAVAALHSAHGRVLRPPAEVIRGGPAAADVVARVEAACALRASPAAASPGRTPLAASPPSVCVVNFSHVLVALRHAPGAGRPIFTEHGRPCEGGDVPQLAAPALGALFANAWTWVPPHSAVPLGLASAAELQDVALEAQVVTEADLAAAARPPAPTTSSRWVRVGSEGGSFDVLPQTRVRYGTPSGRWVERVMPGGRFVADNALFGDPDSGVEKVVEMAVESPPPVAAAGWVSLGPEGGSFDVPPQTRVRYGTGGRWVERVMPGGRFIANNALFGDPASGVAKVVEMAVGPPACVSGTVSLGDIGRTLVLRVPGAAPGGPDGAGAIIVVRVIFLRSELRVVIHDVISLGSDLARVLAAAAPRTGPGGSAEAFELTQDRLPPQVVAAYGGSAQSLLADVCTALSAADSERWLGRPDFDGRVLMTPRGGEKRWDPQPAPLLLTLPRPGATSAVAGGGGAWDSALTLSVASLGVSLIDERPVEMLYVRASGIAAVSTLTGVGSDFGLRIENLQMDDPAADPRENDFPVILCRAREARDPAKGAGAPLVTLLAVAAPHSQGAHLRSVRGAILPVRACLSTRFAVGLYKTADAFRAIVLPAPGESAAAATLAWRHGVRGPDPLAPRGDFPRLSYEPAPAAAAAAAARLAATHAPPVLSLAGPVASAEALLSALAASEAPPLYVESLEVLGPQLKLVVDVRVSRGVNIADMGGAGIPAFVGSAVRTLAGLTVEGAHLDFRLKPHRNVCGTPAQLLARPAAELAAQGAPQAFRVLGAVTGFGGPVASLQATYAGASAGDVMGTARGVQSVASSTLGGVAAKAATLTGAIGSVAAAANAGPGGSSSRPVPQVRPDTAMAVAQSAGWQVVGGFTGALTGLASKTRDGLREGTVVGAAKGVAKGIVGVVASPVEGIMGAVTTGLRGVETSMKSVDDRANEWHRLQRTRAPRAAHGVHRHVVAYSEADASALLRATMALGPSLGPEGTPEAVLHVDHASLLQPPGSRAAAVAGGGVQVVVTSSRALVFRADDESAPPLFCLGVEHLKAELGGPGGADAVTLVLSPAGLARLKAEGRPTAQSGPCTLRLASGAAARSLAMSVGEAAAAWG